MKNGKTYIIAAVVLIGLSAAVFMLPRVPKEAQTRTQGLEGKINRGIALVDNGENPMEGIQLLLSVVKENPKNQKALYHLGLFSMRSQQYEKAVGRFETILSVEEKQEFEEVPYLLAVTFANLGENEKAKELLTNLRVEDEELQHAIDELMLNLD